VKLNAFSRTMVVHMFKEPHIYPKEKQIAITADGISFILGSSHSQNYLPILFQDGNLHRLLSNKTELIHSY